jgi:Mitochondrial ribosomal protein (VAR1)
MNIKKIKIDKNTNFYSREHDLSRAPVPLGSFYPLEKKIDNKFVIFNDQNYQIFKKKNFSLNESVVFKKKESKSTLKTIRYIRNDSGKIRHFTPAAQEWHNSVYSYNTNYTKLLPTADKNLMVLLNSYFNLFLKYKNKKIKRIALKQRRLSANKIFVGKGELKHTNEKVIITSYLYNVEEFYLKNLLLKEARVLFYPKKKLEKETSILKGREVIKYNRRFTLDEFMIWSCNPIWRMYICFKIFWKKYIKLIGPKILRDEEKNIKKLKNDEKKYHIRLIDRTKALFFLAFSSVNNDINTMFSNYLDPFFELVEKKDEKTNKLIKFKEEVNEIKKYYDDPDKFIQLSKKVYEKRLKWLTFLLMVNNVKKEKPFLQKLTALLKNIYNKEVEFNIVNLYKMHLNSDIYTQAVSLKLKNRDNKLFRVLTRSLSKIKLPNVNRISEKYYKTNRDEYLINKIRNVYINFMFNLTNANYKEDNLNNLLLGFFPSSNDLEINVRNRSSFIKRPVSLYRYILKTLKHTKLAGIRVEAKGRLTRRFTAAKSVFKVRWKGGLKNVDSSFKGLSAIMLRGDRKSNLQYSMLSSKNRNGAFAVKTWIGGK